MTTHTARVLALPDSTIMQNKQGELFTVRDIKNLIMAFGAGEPEALDNFLGQFKEADIGS